MAQQAGPSGTAVIPAPAPAAAAASPHVFCSRSGNRSLQCLQFVKAHFCSDLMMQIAEEDGSDSGSETSRRTSVGSVSDVSSSGVSSGVFSLHPTPSHASSPIPTNSPLPPHDSLSPSVDSSPLAIADANPASAATTGFVDLPQEDISRSPTPTVQESETMPPTFNPTDTVESRQKPEETEIPTPVVSVNQHVFNVEQVAEALQQALQPLHAADDLLLAAAAACPSLSSAGPSAFSSKFEMPILEAAAQPSIPVNQTVQDLPLFEMPILAESFYQGSPQSPSFVKQAARAFHTLVAPVNALPVTQDGTAFAAEPFVEEPSSTMHVSAEQEALDVEEAVEALPDMDFAGEIVQETSNESEGTAKPTEMAKVTQIGNISEDDNIEFDKQMDDDGNDTLELLKETLKNFNMKESIEPEQNQINDLVAQYMKYLEIQAEYYKCWVGTLENEKMKYDFQRPLIESRDRLREIAEIMQLLCLENPELDLFHAPTDEFLMETLCEMIDLGNAPNTIRVLMDMEENVHGAWKNGLYAFYRATELPTADPQFFMNHRSVYHRLQLEGQPPVPQAKDECFICGFVTLRMP